ncbi:MAG: hypothetical protein ACRDLF_14585 [Solirubrobacteraceae bacterium]
MDPIQPIERRSPWISELAPAEKQSGRSKTGRRERRKTPRGADGAKPPGASPRERDDPDEDGTGSRGIDVRV